MRQQNLASESRGLVGSRGHFRQSKSDFPVESDHGTAHLPHLWLLFSRSHGVFAFFSSGEVEYWVLEVV